MTNLISWWLVANLLTHVVGSILQTSINPTIGTTMTFFTTKSVYFYTFYDRMLGNLLTGYCITNADLGRFLFSSVIFVGEKLALYLLVKN